MKKNVLNGFTVIAVLAASALLSACGGGGGGGASTPMPSMASAGATPVSPVVVAPVPPATPVVIAPVAPVTAVEVTPVKPILPVVIAPVAPVPVVVVAPVPPATPVVIAQIVPVPAVVVAPVYTLASMPTSTYAVGSAEKFIFDQFNQIRIGGGFGAVQQNSKIDQAAKAHADYIMKNYFVDGQRTNASLGVTPDGVFIAHTELTGTPGFTGILPTDRVSAAGSTYAYVGEENAYKLGTAPGLEPDMSSCLSQLMNSVFHRSGLINPLIIDVGFGIGSAQLTKSGYIIRPCTVTMASQLVLPKMPQGWYGIYPFDQQTNLLTAMAGENPDPVPSSPIKGFPVSIQTAPGQVIAVTSFVLRDASGILMSAKVLTKVDFPTYINSSEAYLIPIGALAPNTSYYATFSGTSNGAPLNKSWTFKTGSK